MAWDYREVEILADQVVADSGTETIDIDVTDPITELFVDFKVMNDTAIAINVPAERCISKIEIVDGGKVLWSTAGLEALAVSCYEKRMYPSVWLYEGLSGNQRAFIPLSFGRYVGDEDFNFNPRALLNPQIKVTWAKNTLHIENQVELGIYAKIMEGASPAGKALMTKSVRVFNTAGSGVENTDLPVDHPIRRLFIGGEKSGASITSIFSQYKLDCDLGKLVVFDLGYRKMTTRCENEFGFFEYRKHDFVTNARYVRSWFGRTMGAQLQSSGVRGFIAAYTSASDNYYVVAYDTSDSPISDVSAVAKVYGSFPQYVLCYPFGRDDSPETWFNAARFGKVKLALTQGAADATARVLVQQSVPI